MFFRLPPKEMLDEADTNRGLENLLKDALASQIMSSFTGTVFLVTLSLSLGASNFYIGIIAAIPPLAQALQIPSIYIIEKLRNRKAITFYASLLSRLFWIILALVPIFLANQLGLGVISIAILINSALAALAGLSWNSWIKDLIPESKLGYFFAKRARMTILIGILCSLFAAAAIDLWQGKFGQQNLVIYSILFTLGCIAGLVGIFFLYQTPEPALQSPDTRFFSRLIKPFQDKNFLSLLKFNFAWNLAVSLATPFFTVYMIQRLELEIFWITALSIVSEMVGFILVRVWGNFADRFSAKAILHFCGPLLLTAFFLWTFTTLPAKYILTIPLVILIHVLQGMATSGVSLALANMSLKLAPAKQGTSFLAAYNLTTAIATGLGPLIGGSFVDLVSRYELSSTITWRSPLREFTIETLSFENWDFFFFFATIIGVYALHLLSQVNEIGDDGKKIMVKDLVGFLAQDFRQISSIFSGRNFLSLPIFAVKVVRRTGRRIVFPKIKK